ncbi:hypothetical protein WR25_16046 [Diploscapter pachys]|uniref:Uncharacterized protein n=1 Tax=Diploscapter pachys TaxID=2018661 RepID=A0A2A2K4N2_9BILA|nr:hypothetical protein WR25_16046 [Diploscapter pachys]
MQGFGQIRSRQRAHRCHQHVSHSTLSKQPLGGSYTSTDMSESDFDRSSPREAAAHGLQYHNLARLDAPIARRRIQRERHRRGGGVGVAIDGHDDLLRRQAELAAGRLENAGIGLMRHDPIDRRRRQAGDIQRFLQHRRQIDDGVAEHLAALHAQLADGASGRRTAIDIEQFVVPPDAAERFGTDHQRAAMDAGAQHRIGDLHRIEEARTHRRDVEGDAIVDAEHRLHLGRGRREGPNPYRERPSGSCVDCLFLEIAEVVGDAAREVGAHHLGGIADRGGDAAFVGAAVALHDDAVEAQEDRAIVIVGIEVVAQQLGRRTRDQEADLRADRAAERALEQIGDEARRPLGGLQRDIAGEAVADDDVVVSGKCVWPRNTAAASRISSVPFWSSLPMLSSATRGLSRSRMVRA